tara:strand:- start:2419 stop:2616 length:198 start_codon:yes stop_codon:yes gene_type:complete
MGRKITSIICTECKKVVTPGECEHKFNFVHRNTKNHVNMRTTWSGTTKMEFNTTTLDESIKGFNK